MPVVLTNFRLTEHMRTAQYTRNPQWLAELQLELFVEISPEHAAELGVKSGGEVLVKSARRSDGIRAKAPVPRRVSSLNIAGKKVRVVAIPFYWDFKGLVTGPITNDLTIDAADTFTSMPEAKVCLCKVEKG